jgi:hypothetical protein
MPDQFGSLAPADYTRDDLQKAPTWEEFQRISRLIPGWSPSAADAALGNTLLGQQQAQQETGFPQQTWMQQKALIPGWSPTAADVAQAPQPLINPFDAWLQQKWTIPGWRPTEQDVAEWTALTARHPTLRPTLGQQRPPQQRR